MSITDDYDNCNATLEINGFQTFNRIVLDIQYNDNQYDFIFNTYADENVGYAGPYNKGDILFSLYYNNNDELYTRWNKYVPYVETNKNDGTYFKKQ